MSEMADLAKPQLLDRLWLPMVRKVGDIFNPRKKKNKDMKVFTLTSDTNFKEVNLILDENIAQRKDIIVWNNEYFKIIRLETELGDSIVLGSTRYENSIQNHNFSLKKHFPFDIINLDFLSQEPICEEGRVEKEIISIEETIKLQNCSNANFLLIYSTIFDNNNLDLNKICDESDRRMLRRWPGLVIDEELLSNPINDNSKKIEAIGCVLTQISRKYNYISDLTDTLSINSNDGNVVYSIAAIFRRK